MSASEKREKQIIIPFRVTTAEAAEIDQAAAAANLTRSAFVRSRSLAAPTGEDYAKGKRMKPTPASRTQTSKAPPLAAAVLARFSGELGKCGSNLNQIAHKLNSNEHVSGEEISAALVWLRELKTEIVGALKG